MNRIKHHLPLHLLRPALAYLAFAVVIATVTATFLAPSTASATIAAPAEAGPACTPDQLEARASKSTASAPKKAPAGNKKSPSKKHLTGKLNINTATSEQIQLLPGVGPAKADRVVAFRKANGPFKRVKDLRRVKGFGYKSLQKLEQYLAINGPTTLQAGGAPTASK